MNIRSTKWLVTLMVRKQMKKEEEEEITRERERGGTILDSEFSQRRVMLDILVI